MSEPMEKLNAYLESDISRLWKLAEEYPGQLSVAQVAEFLGTTTDSVRASIEAGNFGMCWKKPSVNNRGFLVPTPQFIRWYLLRRGVNQL